MLNRIPARLLPLLLLFAAGAGAGQEGSRNAPPRADTAAVHWFRDARFGMFVHWGVYSLLGRGEWVMNNEGIPVAEYEKLPPQFNPTEFDAREWVTMVRESGMKYITITSKHHDGFCMFDSRLTDYDILDRTPFKRDVLKELARECRRQGVKLFFYYSQLDWHHPDYYPRGGTGRRAGRPERGDWNRYKGYYIAQVRELCSNYGEIGGLWFDGWWDRPTAHWGHEVLYPMIHRLQPRALVGNNHHVQPFPGEDFQMFEQDLPGENTAGFNTTIRSQLAYETCRTINNSWGLNNRDTAHKPVEELVRYLVQAAGRDANLLLNTGPLPNGKILPEHRDRYLGIGRWLKTCGESIYATRGGPLRPASWGVSTSRGRQVFAHVLTWPQQGKLDLPGLSGRVLSARPWPAGAPQLKVEQSPNGIRIDLNGLAPDPVDTILLLHLDRPAREVAAAPPPPLAVAAGGTTALPAVEARIEGQARYERDKDAIGFWTRVGDTVSWPVDVARDGRYQVSVTYACNRGSGGSEFQVRIGSQSVTGTVQETGSWTQFTTATLGTVVLRRGPTTVEVRAVKKPGAAVMNLRKITLEFVK